MPPKREILDILHFDPVYKPPFLILCEVVLFLVLR